MCPLKQFAAQEVAARCQHVCLWRDVGACAPLEFNSACSARTSPGRPCPCPCPSPAACHRPSLCHLCRLLSSCRASRHPRRRPGRRCPCRHNPRHPRPPRPRPPGRRSTCRGQPVWRKLLALYLCCPQVQTCLPTARQASCPGSGRPGTSSCRRRRRRPSPVEVAAWPARVRCSGRAWPPWGPSPSAPNGPAVGSPPCPGPCWLVGAPRAAPPPTSAAGVPPVVKPAILSWSRPQRPCRHCARPCCGPGALPGCRRPAAASAWASAAPGSSVGACRPCGPPTSGPASAATSLASPGQAHHGARPGCRPMGFLGWLSCWPDCWTGSAPTAHHCRWSQLWHLVLHCQLR
mmetsp:Transcript_66796/g.184991  ORF Transcript_66796/g.184991 Transcript_66796/m.184991 type:complete len:347 (-) Transcript_66796:1194-2234(-)